jgi:hypothetical protein
MATEIKTWEIIDDKLQSVSSTLTENNRKEKDHLEKWLKTNPYILGDDILIIGEQLHTKSGPLDYLAIDKEGNTVIIELKRDKLPREVITQAFDYASDVASWDIERLRDICLAHTSQSLEDLIAESFENVDIEELTFNINQRILLVGFGVEEPLSRMIEWLSAKSDISINAIILQYIKTSAGNELLSRTVVIPEEVEKSKIKKKKYTIATSDTPGEYDDDKLKELLLKYFNKSLWSAKRIKKVMLPALLKNKVLTREELRQELVNNKEADNLSQAGYFSALISQQLSHEWKDYLRQIIHYEYPNFEWEKDNFSIPENYKSLVQEVLDELEAK